MSKQFIIKDNIYALDKPSQMKQMAELLKEHIVKNKLYTPIVGKNYVFVEGWQFAGGLLGVFPKVKRTEDLSTGSEMKWLAEVELIDRNNKVIGIGIALCSNKENKKKTFDEYAILSMAQTRAIGKAYRNLIGWVMKLAGYEATPSEEMVRVGDKVPEANGKKEDIGEQFKEYSECFNCGAMASPAVTEYSKKHFKKVLCKDCQPKK